MTLSSKSACCRIVVIITIERGSTDNYSVACRKLNAAKREERRQDIAVYGTEVQQAVDYMEERTDVKPGASCVTPGQQIAAADMKV